MSDPIRVAMLRCDGHAYTFGPILAPCDLKVFARNFHAEYHFMIDAYFPDQLLFPPVPGFEIASVWDEDPQRAAGVAEMFHGRPRVCRNIERMLEDADAAFINNQSLDGSDHLKLARPFLERGIPTFIDKPFASTAADARQMVRLSEQHGAALYAASIMLHVPAAQYLRRRFDELPNPVVRGVVNGRVGAKTALAGVIHGLSLAQAVFGAGVDWVECMGQIPLEYLLLHYADDREVLVVNAPHDRCGDHFFCDVYTRSDGCPPKPGHLRSNPIGDPDYVIGARAIVEIFKQMAQTRRSPAPFGPQIELIAIADAGGRAHAEHRRVWLEEVLKDDARLNAHMSS